MIDLHIHTDASSDGQHSPREIFAMAHKIGLRAIAFADHNSIANVAEGQRLSDEFGIEFFPSIEINTFFREMDLHLLAYFIDPGSPNLQAFLQALNQKKKEQAEKRVEKLNELGFVFTWEDLMRFSGESIPTGASYLKAVLSRKENACDIRLRPYIDGDRAYSPYFNFYRDFLRHGKPAYVPINEISTPSAIKEIKKMGGIPILAHPSDTGIENILDLLQEGLEGLEVYSPYHSPEEQEFYLNFSKEKDILITAGSDFHGLGIKPDIALGQIAGDHKRILAKLKERYKYY